MPGKGPYPGTVNKNTLWTVLAVIAAVIVAWWLVSILFSVLWFAVKVGLVIVVAAIVYFVIRALTSSNKA
jgi:hypothetical protein